MDCEGAEYDILYSSKLISKINEIKLEFHNIDEYLSIDRSKFKYSCSGEGLKQFFEDLEYRITDYSISHLHYVPNTNIKMKVGTLFAIKE